MSRSTKRPYITDQQGGCTKEAKRRANRAVRSKGDGEIPANGKAYRKEYCSWSIRDWSFHSPELKKAYRK